MASPSKKRKRLDSQGSLADTSDVGSGDGGYTRDSHDIVVNKSRVYKKKQMKNLQVKSLAETSDKAGEGKTTSREKKNKDVPPILSGQSKNVNGGISNSSVTADSLPMSPSKGSSGTLLRRKYRRERTSSQSSTGMDHGITSLSQMEYFPLSGQEKKHSSTCTATEEEDKSIAPRNSLQTNSENRSVSEIFPWIPKSQSSQESQPPIRLDADGLLVQEDTFKKPLDPVKSSPSKYSSGLVPKSGKKKKKKKHGEKDGTSDETSGVDTDTGASVSTVQSGQEGSDNEKRHTKKKKKKREKDKDVESSAAEEQATNISTVQSADSNVEGDDKKRHKKKKKKKEKEKVETSDSVSTRQADHDNVEEYEGKRHHKKKKKKKDKDAESNTLEGQASAAEDSDIIPPTQESPKPEKSKKKQKRKNEESGLSSGGNGEKIVPHSQGTTLNGDVSSENQNDPNTAGKKKKKSKDKRTESAYTSQSESEVPESDVGSPVKSPLAVPRRHAIENNKANTTGNASKDKPKSSASKLPVWCIEDAGQESQAVSEVFDMFGWGQNKSSSLGTKQSSQGMIRTTSTQPNFDTSVGKGRGTSAERKEKDDLFSYQSHDNSTVAITPQKKSRLSRKNKQKSREQQNVGNNATTHDQHVSNENTGDTVKENTSQDSVDEVPSTSKLPSGSAENNITDRRKRTKKDVLEEAESSVDKEHAEKRRKLERKGKQRNSTEKETPVEEENEEGSPEEAQDQVITDNEDEDQDSDSSGEEFEDSIPSSSTTRPARSSPRIRAIRESRKRRAETSSTGDAEDIWLKGVQALSAEDVQELKEKGVTVRFGHFSRQEKAILKKNMESFCEMHGVEDNRTLLFPHQYPEKKNLKKLIHESGMLRHLAQGLNRPLWNVYTKARYMFSNPEKSGKFSPEEDKLLLRLYKQHGPRWARISRSMGRFEDHIKQRFLYMKGKGKNRGAWSAKENKMLIRAVQAVTGQEDISNITQNINWQACSDMMNTVRGAKQCYEHWLVLINWLSFQQGSPIWNPERDAQLIDEIYKSEAEFDYDIDWQDIAKNMDWLKHHTQARRRFRRLKLRVPDCDRQDMDGILDYLKEDLKKKVQEWMKTKEKRASLPRPAKSGPFIFTDDEDDDDDSDDDTLDADGNTAENHQDNDKSDDDGNDDDDDIDDGTLNTDGNTDNHQDNDDDDDTLNPDANHQDSDNPAPVSDKESAKVDNTGSTSKAGHDNKSDVESSDDSDDDSKTEVDTSDEE
ncbi:PREDICTED: transcription termination factor 1-like isoform X2 [Branchiostoma belcheri]|uniref:Transcription termination factor 1-like isoform X2 n=1 Tax=Branchiostoma belcheri TaxID=7741 RepID=A0A6P4XH03_BRABE|nr:PREDICTED: transcription termination factor 1-like isoform X2 [Branchiostoma belcheri]